MARKRRTRKQRVEAKHAFTLNWEPDNKKGSNKELVKGQIKSGTKPKNKKVIGSKKAKISAKQTVWAQTKRDIAKSLLLASLILSLEVLLYLIQG